MLFIPNYINEGTPENPINKGFQSVKNLHYIEDGKKKIFSQAGINQYFLYEAFSYSSDRFAISSFTETILSTR